MMRSLKPACLAAMMAITAPALADSGLPDTALLEAIAAATTDGEADTLLALMQEAKTRGLLMFPKPKRCEFPAPQTAYFENEFYSGAVRRGLFTDLAEEAIAAGNCGCVWDEVDLDAYTQARVGKNAEGLTEIDYNLIRKYRRAEWRDVQTQYRDFRRQSCGE